MTRAIASKYAVSSSRAAAREELDDILPILIVIPLELRAGLRQVNL